MIPYNFIDNIQNCYYIVPGIIYYSHIPTGFLVLFISSFVFLKNKNIQSKALLFLSIIFSTWLFASLVVWISMDSRVIMFTWYFFGVLTVLLYLSSFYFLYVFLNKKDLGINLKIVLLFILILTLFLSFRSIHGFDLINCEAMESTWFISFYYIFIGAVSLISIWFFSSFKYIREADRSIKKQIILISSSLTFFLIAFIMAGYYASYIDNFELEQYGLFGMTIFMAFLAYLIVKFKAFNIKLLGAQALVWAMVILIGSQFLFIKSNINKVLNSVTFVTVSISGLILVRSVKKVDSQREQLAQANQNQQSLIHFITHQVKGYLTKSRNIFDGLVAGDYGQIPEEAQNIAKHGFDSDTRGVETVLSILRASDLRNGKTEFKKEKANISAMVAEVIEFRQEMAKAKNLDLTFEIEPNIEATVDTLQLKEVFKNLITNSILYTPKGTVHVVLKKENGKIKFSVVDTGVGLSPKDKEKLFTEGGKGEDSLKSNADSTGYGLFIAKQIVNKHQGVIGAHSAGRDKGSEFFVILPQI